MRTHLGHHQRALIAALRSGERLWFVTGGRWLLGTQRQDKAVCVSLWQRGYLMQQAIETVGEGYRQEYTLTERGKRG